jgi:hypothetical protein
MYSEAVLDFPAPVGPITIIVVIAISLSVATTRADRHMDVLTML